MEKKYAEAAVEFARQVNDGRMGYIGTCGTMRHRTGGRRPRCVGGPQRTGNRVASGVGQLTGRGSHPNNRTMP